MLVDGEFLEADLDLLRGEEGVLDRGQVVDLEWLTEPLFDYILMLNSYPFFGLDINLILRF